MWPLSSLSPSQTTVFTPQRNTDLMFNYPLLCFLYNILRRACHFASFTLQVRLSLPSWCSSVQLLLCSCTTWTRCRLIEKNSSARRNGKRKVESCVIKLSYQIVEKTHFTPQLIYKTKREQFDDTFLAVPSEQII